jgi:hypothetical protein
MIARWASSRAGVLFVIGVSLLATAEAQETTLRTRSTLVLVPTLIKDSQGTVVYGLEASDFVVEDSGVEQPLRVDEAPEGQPISLVIAIQRGRRASYEFPRMQGLRTMLGPLFDIDSSRIAIVEFDSQVELTGTSPITKRSSMPTLPICNPGTMAPLSWTRLPIPSNYSEMSSRTANVSCS